MDNFKLIIDTIIPSFLKETKHDYAIIGGKAFQIYFKNIKTIDWDIVTNSNPQLFIADLKTYITSKYKIPKRDLEDSISGINFNNTLEEEEPLYQLGYKKYKGKDELDRFFIDVKNDTIKKYNTIIVNDLKVASLEYLYKDAMFTLKNRKKLLNTTASISVKEETIRSQIQYLKTDIKHIIKQNYDNVDHFHKNLLHNFKDGTKVKTNLKEFLDKFIKYYNGDHLKKINKLKNEYDTLYSEILFKYHADKNNTTLTEKKKMLYVVIDALDNFYEESEKYSNRTTEIASMKTFIKEQTITFDTMVSKYLKSAQRIDLIKNIEKNDPFSKDFKKYIRDNCKMDVFTIKIDKVIKYPCRKHRRSKSNSTLKSS